MSTIKSVSSIWLLLVSSFLLVTTSGNANATCGTAASCVQLTQVKVHTKRPDRCNGISDRQWITQNRSRSGRTIVAFFKQTRFEAATGTKTESMFDLDLKPATQTRLSCDVVEIIDTNNQKTGRYANVTIELVAACFADDAACLAANPRN